MLHASVCALLGPAAIAADSPPDVYVYSTYQYCAFSGQDRADELYEKVQKPLDDAAVKDGTITSYGWMAHHTGGQWRRATYFTANGLDALMDADQKARSRVPSKDDARLDEEFSTICSSHDDYIWRRVAGNVGTATRGGAAFSTYYVCHQGREAQADELVKHTLGPMLDKMVQDGKLKTWGWNEHIVGGEYRRMATMSAANVTSVMAARTAMIEALEESAAGTLLSNICPSHADYIWEIKFQAP